MMKLNIIFNWLTELFVCLTIFCNTFIFLVDAYKLSQFVFLSTFFQFQKKEKNENFSQ